VKTTVTYSDIAARCPKIEQYIRQLRPTENPRQNPYRLYEKSKQYLVPLLPDLPGAYDVIIREVTRRLNL
jgi:hypothetical protein